MERIGFFKPVGQESVVVEGGSRRVDKDVAVAKGGDEKVAFCYHMWRYFVSNL